jgi:polyisoprenoid-binding protein YceI
MKRASFLVGFAFLAFIVLSRNGTEAVTTTFSDRFAGSAAIGDSGIYTFDKPHTFIEFRVRHLGMIEVPGYFRDFTGAVNFDAKDVSKSTVEFTAKATSVDTGVTRRDNHLRTADFFDAEKFPDITFKSTRIEKKGKTLMLTGDFTMKGVTKSISFPFQIAGWVPADERSGDKMGITAETSINRKDFGVNYDAKLPSGIPAVADNIKIVLQIEAEKKPLKRPDATPANN